MVDVHTGVSLWKQWEPPRRVLAALVLSAVACRASAQQPGAEQSAWYMYFGDHPLSEKWGIHLEAQIRREPIVRDPEQNLLRFGINRHFAQNWTIRPGYTYVRGYTFGATEAGASKLRHTLLTDLEWQRKLGSIEVLQRLRGEQSFAGSRTPGQATLWSERQRLRYRLGGTIMSGQPGSGVLPHYYTIYDEVALHFGEAQRGIYDQNRIYAALGWKAGRFWKFEAGYLRQDLPQANGVVGPHGNALQMAVRSTVPFHHRP